MDWRRMNEMKGKKRGWEGENDRKETRKKKSNHRKKK